MPENAVETIEFIDYLKQKTFNATEIHIVCLEQTENSDEIKKFNTIMQELISINFLFPNVKYYDFKYAIERNGLKIHTEYLLTSAINFDS